MATLQVIMRAAVLWWAMAAAMLRLRPAKARHRDRRIPWTGY